MNIYKVIAMSVAGRYYYRALPIACLVDLTGSTSRPIIGNGRVKFQSVHLSFVHNLNQGKTLPLPPPEPGSGAIPIVSARDSCEAVSEKVLPPLLPLPDRLINPAPPETVPPPPPPVAGAIAIVTVRHSSEA